ncbi:MAG: glycosyltransferase, partial [Methylobacterium sp.]
MTTPNRSGSPQAASLPRSRRGPATRSFVLDGAARDLDLADTDLGGSWATIRFRDVGSAGVCRLVLSARVLGPDGRPGIVALSEEAEGGDRFVWTGRLPEGLRALRVTPLTRETAFHLDGFTIRRVRRIGLVARALPRNPGLTARAVYWRALGLKVRGRALLLRALHDRTETGYATWIARFDTLSQADRRRIRDEIDAWPDAPRISVVMPVHDPAPRVLDAAIRSVRAQLYPNWELSIVDDASTDPAIPRLLARHAQQDPRIHVLRRAENSHIARATNDALAQANGPFIAFLDHDDVLAEGALYHVAAAIRAAPELVLIYSDEDKIDAPGRRSCPRRC